MLIKLKNIVSDFVSVYNQNKKQYPLYNETIPPAHGWGIYSTQPEDYKELMRYFKRSPEAIGIVRAIITDIFSDGYRFVGPAIHTKKAEEYAKRNFLKQELYSAGYDWMILGDGALWNGMIDKVKYKEIVSASIKQVTGLEVKEADLKQYETDYVSPRELRHLPWSTMNIEHDLEKINTFKQIVYGHVRSWKPEEVIHAMFMKLDGKVYGFSPFVGSMSIVSTMAMIKDLNGGFFENGGVPDWMFIFPKELASSPNVESLRQVLKEKKRSMNKGGNLVITGDCDPTQLNKFDKDMEFRELAVYYAGLLAFAFNMPITRIQALMGLKSVGNAGGDLSDAGYWRSISASQDYWEELLNSELFQPHFKVDIRFNRSYKQDEFRETQNKLQRSDYVLRVLSNLHIPVTDEWVYNELDIDNKWLEKEKSGEPVKIDRDKLQQSNLFRQGFQRNNDVTDGDSKRRANQERARGQNNFGNPET